MTDRPPRDPFDAQRAAFLLLSALVGYVMASGWMLGALCYVHTIECKPGEWGVRNVIADTLLPVLIMFLFQARQPPPK